MSGVFEAVYTVCTSGSMMSEISCCSTVVGSDLSLGVGVETSDLDACWVTLFVKFLAEKRSDATYEVYRSNSLILVMTTHGYAEMLY